MQVNLSTEYTLAKIQYLFTTESNTGFKGICQMTIPFIWRFSRLNLLQMGIFGCMTAALLVKGKRRSKKHLFSMEKPFGRLNKKLSGQMIKEKHRATTPIAARCKGDMPKHTT